MNTTKPNIFTYTDYRVFLQDTYAYIKSIDKKYSHRFFAHHIGASSPSWLSDIIHHRINLTQNFIYKIVKFLKFSSKESDFFDLLVQYDQAASVEQKNAYLEKILSHKELKIDLITRNQFDYFRHWYIPVIRELLFFYDFRDNFQELSKKLSPPIKLSESKKAIQVLTELQFIALNSNGYYKPTSALLRKDTSFKYLFLYNYLKSFMDLGKEALDRHPKDQRDISAITIHLTEKKFEIAKDEIQSLRGKLLMLSDQESNHNTDGDMNSVFQCNIQLFPLTNK